MTTKATAAHTEGLHANVEGIPERYAEGLANARLIAAAPELLALLRDLVKHDADQDDSVVRSHLARIDGE